MKVLNTISGFLAWRSNKETGNSWGIWCWKPAGFDYRASRGLVETDSSFGEHKQKRGAVTPLEWIGFTHEEIALKLSKCLEILYFTKSIVCFVCMLVSQLWWIFATPWTVAYQASLSLGFSRQEYWSGLPFPSPGDLPNPGIEPGSPALEADTLTSELHLWNL